MRVLATVVLAVVLFLVADATAAQDPPRDLVAEGEELYDRSCVGCHGIDGAGTEQGPPLLASGAASADFMLTTGRMPLSRTGIQPPRKEPAFDPDEIDALVAYVASLGTGPPIPDVDPGRGDLAFGGELYRLHCAACHNAAGVGAPLSSGRHAPALDQATPVQVGEAIRTGPGQMPEFDDDTLTDEDLDDLAAYVDYLRDPADPGGFPLGRSGPVAEGFAIWLVGIGALIVLVRWITREPA
jgi:ubiquinol-cytochrome c reductase cytochrome c subunit